MNRIDEHVGGLADRLPSLSLDERVEVLRQARVSALADHMADALKHRHERYAASLPATVRAARLSRFQPRDEADRAVLAAARAWVLATVEVGTRNLSIFGPPGTGKTWLLAAIGWALLPTERPAVYVRAPAAWAAIKASYDGQGESESSLMGRWLQAPVLLLDELGAGHITEPYRAFVADIIGQRTDESRPTVVASNLALKNWSSVCDDRAVDRMAGGVQLPVLGASRRGA